MTSQTTITITFVIYITGMLAIGWWAFSRTRDFGDYILGGRRLGPIVTAISAGASDMSGWLLLGLPGLAYASGFEAVWLAFGLLVGTWLNWRLIAGRLRAYSEVAGNALTLPEFLEYRFRDRRHLLRMVSAFFILLFFLFYTSSGLVAAGKLFASVFGIPYLQAVTIGVLTIFIYTVFGGFLAVSWTDLLQGLLMALALTLVPIIALASLGGWSDASAMISETNPQLTNMWSSSDGSQLTLIAVGSALAWGLGYFGQPHILARFKAIRSVDAIPTARRIAVGWTALTLTGALLVGLTGIAYLDTPLIGNDTEKVFIHLVSALLHPIPAGICLAAILAAIMSTADSQLLVSSSALTEDFYKALFRKRASAKELVWIGRFAVLIIALFAYWFALNPDSNVLDLVGYAWAGFGAAFGPVLLLSLFWPRMTASGALAGIITGGVTVVAWKFAADMPSTQTLDDWLQQLLALYELVPGFILSAIATIAVSLLSAAPERNIVQEFEFVAKRC